LTQFERNYETYTRNLKMTFGDIIANEKFKMFDTSPIDVLSHLELTDTINGISIRALNFRLLPSKSQVDGKQFENPTFRESEYLKYFQDNSNEGFLKENDDLREVLLNDARTVVNIGKTTHQELIKPFIYMAEVTGNMKKFVDKSFNINSEVITCLLPPATYDTQQYPIEPNEYNLNKVNLARLLTYGIQTLLDSTWGLFGRLNEFYTIRKDKVYLEQEEAKIVVPTQQKLWK
ncbi:unnamed protein product, partial [Didymodactylos carnosus]